MARILFVGIDYYGYTARIVEEMRAQGHSVSFHSMELYGFWHKVAKRYARPRFARALEQHHAAILATERGNAYDMVVFLQVHEMAESMLAAFRAAFADARFVLYNWDSLRTHDYRRFLPYFDRALTFDGDDAATLSIDHLPLFALPEYFAARRDRPKRWDLYFVGSVVTPARLRAIRSLSRFAESTGLRLRTHLHCSAAGKLMLLRRGLWMPGLTGRSVTQGEIIDMMEQSRAVFDFANHQQAGYTMRFIENLCAGMKIVTSNGRVMDEAFYSPDRFLVLEDTMDFGAVRAFLEVPLAADRDFERFSLRSWVHELLA